MMKERQIESRFQFGGDKIVLILTIFFSIISLYAVSSSSDHVGSQLFHLSLCFAAIFVFYKIDYRTLSGFSFIFLIGAFILLVFTLLSEGKRRSISFLGFEIQTFYLIGFLVVFYISKFVAVRMNKEEELTTKDILTIFVIMGIFCGGMALANFSTALLLFLTCFTVLFVANVRVKYLLALLAVCLIGGVSVLVFDIGRGDTGSNRIAYFFTSKKSGGTIDKATADYGRQMILAKAAISRSTWIPAGPGQGVIKKSLAQKDTDYVYATVVEEIGIIGGIVIILFYLILFYRAMKIAQRSDGYFGRLLAVGIGFWFTCQALVHIGVNCELLPATGQTLPLISRGGASLLFSGMMIGMLLNISKNNVPVNIRKR